MPGGRARFGAPGGARLASEYQDRQREVRDVARGGEDRWPQVRPVRPGAPLPPRAPTAERAPARAVGGLLIAAGTGAGVLAAGVGCSGRPARRTRVTVTAALEGIDGWQLGPTGPDDAVEGYADRVSVLRGEKFGLYVSTTARAFRVSARRVGWYGGRQAALVWESGRVAGRRQARPVLAVPTRTVHARWDQSPGSDR